MALSHVERRLTRVPVLRGAHEQNPDRVFLAPGADHVEGQMVEKADDIHAPAFGGQGQDMGLQNHQDVSVLALADLEMTVRAPGGDVYICERAQTLPVIELEGVPRLHIQEDEAGDGFEQRLFVAGKTLR